MLKRISALDGKHIAQMASGSGSYFYNYKGYNSQILIALVNAKNTGSCITTQDLMADAMTQLFSMKAH